MQDFWPACGYRHLEVTERGWLRPTPAYFAAQLALPELALVEESCDAERALHAALREQPMQAVAPHRLARLHDADVRANYALFLAFRDALASAGTLEAYYLALMRGGAVTIPPVFVDRIVQAVLRHLLEASGDAFEARAAELLFRPQRLTLAEGRLLSADHGTVDLLQETAGLGDIGRLLVQNHAPMPATQMAVLVPDNATDYWRKTCGKATDAASPAADRYTMLLDLTHEATTDIGHGLAFTTTRAHSGLKALSRVLEKWVAHLLGVAVSITPLQKIDDDAWRWHVGLDTESMALLNDLYEDRAVEPERMQRLVSLFRLDFADPHEMRADVAGKPVYLGLAMTAQNTCRLKPQNLLLNLPLAASM